MEKDENYIVQAIEHGYKTIGFTDYVFLPNYVQKGTRGNYELLDEYVQSINFLKEKYKGVVDVYSGFECEWLNVTFTQYYKNLLNNHIVDYLILGQHAYFEEGEIKYYNRLSDPSLALKKYTKDVIDAMNSGLFTYLAHPDIFMVYKKTWDEQCKNCSIKIINTAIKNDMPLEINMGRSRVGGYYFGKDVSNAEYPNIEFWRLAKKLGAKIVLGIDAHSPKDLYLGPFKEFFEMIEKLDIKLLSKKEITFKKIS